jgi:hypothetical protein
MTPAGARAIGFVVTMVGVGIRLDSTWTTVGTVVLAVGCALGGWGLVAGAFVREGPER